MKTILLHGIVLLFTLPLFSQVDEDFKESEEDPIEILSLKKGKAPDPVINSIQTDFREGKVMETFNFPYLFKKYGWTPLIDTTDVNLPKPDRYEVYLTSKDGSKMYAVYTADGKLIRSREVILDAVLSKKIELFLAKSKFKDWKIIGDKEIITDFENNASKHYIVKVKKNNRTKTLYFDENGNRLSNFKA